MGADVPSPAVSVVFVESFFSSLCCLFETFAREDAGCIMTSSCSSRICVTVAFLFRIATGYSHAKSLLINTYRNEITSEIIGSLARRGRRASAAREDTQLDSKSPAQHTRHDLTDLKLQLGLGNPLFIIRSGK